MKTLKITTYFTAEEADCLYQLMDELKTAIWRSYGDAIIEMHKEIALEEDNLTQENSPNDDLPF